MILSYRRYITLTLTLSLSLFPLPPPPFPTIMPALSKKQQEALAKYRGQQKPSFTRSLFYLFNASAVVLLTICKCWSGVVWCSSLRMDCLPKRSISLLQLLLLLPHYCHSNYCPQHTTHTTIFIHAYSAILSD